MKVEIRSRLVNSSCSPGRAGALSEGSGEVACNRNCQSCTYLSKNDKKTRCHCQDFIIIQTGNTHYYTGLILVPGCSSVILNEFRLLPLG